MLFHVSIEADEPRRVAQFLTDIWGGETAPFPFVSEGSWVALAGDDRGTMIEVYPRGTELVPGEDGASGRAGARRRNNPTHFAIATSRDLIEVLEIADRYGWHAQHFMRGGRFGVIEIWIEGCQMIEVLTPQMQAEYLDTVTVENWREMVAAREMAEAA